MTTNQTPATGERTKQRRDLDLVLRDDIALGMAQPRKLPRQDKPSR